MPWTVGILTKLYYLCLFNLRKITHNVTVQVKYGACSMQGWRKTMEDTHITDTSSLGEDIYLFSVFDGHGGNEVSKYLQDNFCEFLKENIYFKKKEYELALVQTFKKLDESLTTPDVNDQLKDFSSVAKESWEKPGMKGVAYGVGSTA